MLIANKFKLSDKICEGKFGTVYKGININNNNYIAIKVEKSNNKLSLLKREANILYYLNKELVCNISKIIWYEKYKNYNYLIINILGESLTFYINKNKLNINNIKYIGKELIIIIKNIHNKHIIHRDLKPDNILNNYNMPNKFVCNLIDFGLCNIFLDKNNNHIPENNINNIIGTPNYVSLNIHKYIQPSRRDDIESIIYILIYCINDGHLIWNNKYLDDMMLIKNNIIYNNDIPSFIVDMLKYVRNMKFNEKPNYDYLFKLLE